MPSRPDPTPVRERCSLPTDTSDDAAHQIPSERERPENPSQRLASLMAVLGHAQSTVRSNLDLATMESLTDLLPIAVLILIDGRIVYANPKGLIKWG